jgi:hypothetical protein
MENELTSGDTNRGILTRPTFRCEGASGVGHQFLFNEHRVIF